MSGQSRTQAPWIWGHADLASPHCRVSQADGIVTWAPPSPAHEAQVSPSKLGGSGAVSLPAAATHVGLQPGGCSAPTSSGPAHRGALAPGSDPPHISEASSLHFTRSQAAFIAWLLACCPSSTSWMQNCNLHWTDQSPGIFLSPALREAPSRCWLPQLRAVG